MKKFILFLISVFIFIAFNLNCAAMKDDLQMEFEQMYVKIALNQSKITQIKDFMVISYLMNFFKPVGMTEDARHRNKKLSKIDAEKLNKKFANLILKSIGKKSQDEESYLYLQRIFSDGIEEFEGFDKFFPEKKDWEFNKKIIYIYNIYRQLQKNGALPKI